MENEGFINGCDALEILYKTGNHEEQPEYTELIIEHEGQTYAVMARKVKKPLNNIEELI
jgi:hypothetical protein